jgi:2-methylcitrate dehydratase PrpD
LRVTGAPGAEVLAAYALGLEVAGKLGRALGHGHYSRGWHSTATAGAFSATAAAARVWKLDAAQLQMAWGLAASQLSGLIRNFGTMTKPFHAGHAARSGVLSALLAREGWTASEQALEGPQGFLAVLGAGGLRPERLASLGDPWKILTTGVAVKPYPSCACTHSIIDGARELRQRHRLRPDDIAEVTVGVNVSVPNILIHANPRTGLEAKFSGEFAAAAALVEERIGIQTFTDDKVQDPVIRALLPRVRVVVDPDIPGDLERHMWSRLRVRLADGRTLEIGPRQVPGHPGNPLSADQLREKFEECATLVLSPERTQILREMVETLDTCPDLRSLTAIL